MALVDFEELAARSFEEPGDRELRAAIQVCADDLTQREDPRGPLITMEHQLRDADHRRAVELRAAIHEYSMGEAGALLGAAAPLMQANRGRTVSLEWRSGRLYGITLDARYLPKQSKMTPGELVDVVLKAPAAADLRRLRVRVRVPEHTRSIVTMLSTRKVAPPLEELHIYTTAWPQETAPEQAFLQDRYPRLYSVVLEARLISLPLRGYLKKEPLEALVPEILSVDPPTTHPARTFLGRALTHLEPALRGAALQRITELGPRAAVFERALITLLQPGLATKFQPTMLGQQMKLPLVEALVAIEPSRAARHELDKIASRPDYYESAARSVAGKATELDRR